MHGWLGVRVYWVRSGPLVDNEPAANAALALSKIVWFTLKTVAYCSVQGSWSTVDWRPSTRTRRQSCGRLATTSTKWRRWTLVDRRVLSGRRFELLSRHLSRSRRLPCSYVCFSCIIVKSHELFTFAASVKVNDPYEKAVDYWLAITLIMKKIVRCLFT